MKSKIKLHSLEFFKAFAIGAILLIFAEISFYKFMPTQYWVQYENIKFVNPVKGGEKPFLQSFVYRRKGTIQKGYDRLYCDFGDSRGYRLIKSVPYSVKIEEESLPNNPSPPWQLDVEIPTIAQACLVSSSIILNLGMFNIQRVAGFIESSPITLRSN